MPIRPSFLVSILLLAAPALLDLPLAAQVAAPPALVNPFVIAGDPAPAAPNPSTAACPAGAAAIKKDISDAAAAQLAATLTFALTQQLTATGAATPIQPGQSLAPGAVTFSGCITRIEAGSKGKRILVGMTSGASWLGAHVVIARHTATGDQVLRDFDTEIKGQNVAPPVFGGVIYNAVHQSKTTLEADAPRLAEKIVAQFRSTAPAAAASSTPW